MKTAANLPDIKCKFDAIVDALEQKIRELRTFAADNLAQPVAVNGATEQIISVADAAEVLSKSTKTVLRYCRAGSLKAYKAPGAKLTTGVYLSSLNALLND
ncbi:MAG: helix-turn-helix domain-containing protein [Kiritimatiellia bacterium]